MVNELRGHPILSHMLICFSTHCTMIQAFHLLLGFAENQGVFWDFKIQNSIRITEGLDNGDSDNRGSTVLENYI